MRFKFCLYSFIVAGIMLPSLVKAKNSFDKNILVQNINIANTATEKLLALVALSDHFLSEKRIDSAAVYLDEASIVAQSLDMSNILIQELTNEQAKAIAQYHSVRGYYYFYLFERFLAIESFEKAILYFSKLQDNKNIADCINNLAVLYRDIGDLENATLLNIQALEIYDQLNDIDGKLNVMFTLSVIYREQENLDRSLSMANEILGFYRKKNDKKGEANVLNLIAGIQKDLGDTTIAIVNYSNALAIYKDLRDLGGQAKVMNNIGVLYKHWKEWDKALQYFSAAYEITVQQDYLVGQAFALENIASVYFSKKDWEKSIEYLQRVQEAATSINLPELNLRVAHLFFRIYESQENWLKALHWHKNYLAIKENISNDQLLSKVELENQKHEFEKSKLVANKEAEKRLVVHLERENRQRVIIIVALLLISVLAVFSFYIHKKLKQLKMKNKIILEQSEERKLLLKEIHHRVKNNFQIVGSLLRLQSYTLNNEEAIQSFEESINRINAMSLVHDIIYKQDRFDRIQAMEYLQKLTEQLKKYAPQKNLKIDIDTRETFLEVDTLIYLGIILNELIINSFKYGFTDAITSPTIKIELWEDSDCYILTYKENGVGIDKVKYEESFGMELINTVAEQLNGKVEIINNKFWSTIFKFRFMKEDEAH